MAVSLLEEACKAEDRNAHAKIQECEAWTVALEAVEALVVLLDSQKMLQTVATSPAIKVHNEASS